MYKLVAIDLDGTLLNSYGQISNRNLETLKKAIAKGTYIVLASGRNTISVKNFANEIGARDYIICGNGANVYDLKNNKNVYSRYLDKKKVLELIKIFDDNSIYYSINTEDSIITKSLNYNVLFYYNENNLKEDDKKAKIQITSDVYKYISERTEEDYLKINICDNLSTIFNSITNKVKKIKGIDVLDVGHMSRKIIKTGTEEKSIEYYYTEITKENTNKWDAIEYLINKLEIKKEEVIAIGDNVNDEIMIKNAGLGIAMANSAPYVQKNADEVTFNNNQDGVANIIEKYILSN